MKKNLFLLLVIAMFCSAISMAQGIHASSNGFVQISPTQPPQDFVEITQALKKPILIRANFQQAKYLKILKKPFISSGKLIFVREKGVYWEIIQPLKNAYVISNDGISLISKSAENILPSASPISESISRIFSAIIGGNIEILGDAFDIFYQSENQNWHIKLRPKDKLIAKVLASIVLSGSLAINEIKISEHGGDHTEITFSEMMHDVGELTAVELSYFGG